jgi:hypothetical protein
MSALLIEFQGGDEAETELPTDTWNRLTEVVREHFRS